jgi:hypothetical protein
VTVLEGLALIGAFVVTFVAAFCLSQWRYKRRDRIRVYRIMRQLRQQDQGWPK